MSVTSKAFILDTHLYDCHLNPPEALVIIYVSFRFVSTIFNEGAYLT